jgi:parallel beta-helix repeat protein
LVIFLLSSLNAKATEVSGHLSSDTTWNATGNPYIITSRLTVEENVTLNINSGVEIRLNQGARIDVDGVLNANGTSEEMIFFKPENENPGHWDWNSIKIKEKGRAYFDYCDISYGRYAIHIESKSGDNQIKNCNIWSNLYGIYLYQTSNITIINSKISNNDYGIYTVEVEDLELANDVIENNINGFHLGWTSNSSLYNVTISENANYGIDIVRSNNCTIDKSNITKNHLLGLNIRSSLGISVSNVHFFQNYDRSLDIWGYAKEQFDLYFINNIVNGRPLYYYYNISDMTIEQLDAGSVIITWSDNITINYCKILNGDGISFYHSTNSTINECNLSDNFIGIYLYKSHPENLDENIGKNIISNNILTNNHYGIKLNHSYNNNITENEFIKNEFGLLSYFSHQNIYHNNFINNTIQAEGGKNWDNGKEGNHWTDYSGYDRDGDGIGDRKYQIDYNYHIFRGTYDYFPLMNPWNGSLPPDTKPPYLMVNATLNSSRIMLPYEEQIIRLWPSELGRYEIIINTDGKEGFNNQTDVTLTGSITERSQSSFGYILHNVDWDCKDDQGNYVKQGSYQIQIMLWDKVGNPMIEPHNIESMEIAYDFDNDGIADEPDPIDDPDNIFNFVLDTSMILILLLIISIISYVIIIFFILKKDKKGDNGQ